MNGQEPIAQGCSRGIYGRQYVYYITVGADSIII